MTVTTLSSKTVHDVYKKFISLARGEGPVHENYTDELHKRDLQENTLTLDEWSWSGKRRVITAIQAIRGLTPEQQFEKKIISALTPIEGLLISYEMRKLFGIELLSSLVDFNQKGEFQINQKYDIICPSWRNKLIRGLRFFTIGDMRKW